MTKVGIHTYGIIPSNISNLAYVEYLIKGFFMQILAHEREYFEK